MKKRINISMKSNLMQLFKKKLFTVNKSYHESFKHLSNKELVGLCDHNFLSEKVHKELKSSVTESDIKEFNQSLDVYRHFGGEHNQLITSVFETKQVLTENYVENLVFNKIETKSEHFDPILKKLALKSGGSKA